MKKGFFESLLESAVLFAAVQHSADQNGKPDPYKAAGIAYGIKGKLTDSDIAELGAILGSQGAFDDDKK